MLLYQLLQSAGGFWQAFGLLSCFNDTSNQEAFEHVDSLQFPCLKIVPEEWGRVKWKGEANKHGPSEGTEFEQLDGARAQLRSHGEIVSGRKGGSMAGKEGGEEDLMWNMNAACQGDVNWERCRLPPAAVLLHPIKATAYSIVQLAGAPCCQERLAKYDDWWFISCPRRLDGNRPRAQGCSPPRWDERPS